MDDSIAGGGGLNIGLLTEEIITILNRHRPSKAPLANDFINHGEVEATYLAVFENSRWHKKHRFVEAAEYLGQYYGVHLQSSGTLFFCACGKSHCQRKTQLRVLDGSNRPDEHKRKTTPPSNLECDMVIRTRFYPKPVVGDGIKSYNRNLIVTNLNPKHNHPLTKKMYIIAKKSSRSYVILPSVQRKVLEMMDSGPMLTKNLRNFLQNRFLDTVKITSVTIFNVRIQVKKLKNQYGGVLP